jgi:hypothetical protein
MCFVFANLAQNIAHGSKARTTPFFSQQIQAFPPGAHLRRGRCCGFLACYLWVIESVKSEASSQKLLFLKGKNAAV